MKVLDTVARVALGSPHAERMLYPVLDKNMDLLRFNVLFLTEELSIGHKVPIYNALNEEQKLFLNHLIYFVHYYRIVGGERVVIQNNIALARHIKQDHISKYLLLEVEEELDHIKTFTTIMRKMAEHYNLDTSHLKNKWVHTFSTNQIFLETMIKCFGADYVLTYFISRGFFNHMGYGFESEVPRGADPKGPIKELSQLHIIDEKRHMVVSNGFAQAAREYFPSSIVNKTMNLGFAPLQNAIIKGSFSEKFTKKIEFNLTFSLLKQSALFKNFSQSELHKFCTDHYGQITGVEEVKNKVMQPRNERILETSGLSPQAKVRWRKVMEADCGHLEFFPKAAAS